MKFVIIFVAINILAIWGLFKFIPESAQIYMAAVAPCHIPDRHKQAENRTKDSNLLSNLLGYMFRVRYEHFNSPVILNDALYGNFEIIRPLILASDETKGACNTVIEPLFHKFIRMGAPVDYYLQNGTTSLHEAIVSGNTYFVRLLLEAGADPNLEVTGKNREKSYNALKLAVKFYEEDNTPSRSEIVELIKGINENKPMQLN